ncbi:putative uncharacterized hydrolase [Escovopsis weberi]|uniref:Uncharacterized hydrolase n=1 Tax=Escovopsis weberi TaxID=150374 RepID=A0A0M8MZE7_ESCWE|nr:putative uncharacterized hydrolase [Escovopsis weberi]
MGKPNLLLTFDAFGTLFRPKAPPVEQYAQVARQLGLSGFRDDELQASLAEAFKAEAKQHPNYGRATGLGATRWWTNVIHATFAPFIKHGESLPPDLAPRLIHRFSSREAYSMEPRLVSSLQTVKRRRSPPSTPPLPSDVLVGVLTNSDDRVPSILASFGMRVSPLRYGPGDPQAPAATAAPAMRAPGAPHDIDFHCMSYDVGFEKPDGRMFRAAEDMLAQMLAAREGEKQGRGQGQGQGADEAARVDSGACSWRKVHVGDEFAKDVVGALDAGWNAVLLDEEGRDDGRLPWLEDLGDAGTVEDLFREYGAVRVRSLTSLMSWLSKD